MSCSSLQHDAMMEERRILCRLTIVHTQYGNTSNYRQEVKVPAEHIIVAPCGDSKTTSAADEKSGPASAKKSVRGLAKVGEYFLPPELEHTIKNKQARSRQDEVS